MTQWIGLVIVCLITTIFLLVVFSPLLQLLMPPIGKMIEVDPVAAGVAAWLRDRPQEWHMLRATGVGQYALRCQFARLEVVLGPAGRIQVGREGFGLTEFQGASRKVLARAIDQWLSETAQSMKLRGSR